MPKKQKTKPPAASSGSRDLFRFPRHQLAVTQMLELQPSELRGCQQAQDGLAETAGPGVWRSPVFVVASYTLATLLTNRERAQQWLADQQAASYTPLPIWGIEVRGNSNHEGLRIPGNEPHADPRRIERVLAPQALVWVDTERGRAAFVGWIFHFEAERFEHTSGTQVEYRVPPDRLYGLGSLQAWAGDQLQPATPSQPTEKDGA